MALIQRNSLVIFDLESLDGWVTIFHSQFADSTYRVLDLNQADVHPDGRKVLAITENVSAFFRSDLSAAEFMVKIEESEAGAVCPVCGEMHKLGGWLELYADLSHECKFDKPSGIPSAWPLDAPDTLMTVCRACRYKDILKYFRCENWKQAG